MNKFKPILTNTFNPYDKGVSRDALEKELRKLSKRANQRLVRLESSKSAISGESYSSYGAYQVYAVPALEGRRRFRESGYTKMSVNELAERITKLQTFLGSSSSTVLGQRLAEERRQSAFESGNWGAARLVEGLDNRAIKAASRKDFYDFLNSKLFSDLKSLKFSSDQLIEDYDELTEQLTPDEAYDRLSSAYEQFLDDREAAYSDFKSFLDFPAL